MFNLNLKISLLRNAIPCKTTRRMLTGFLSGLFCTHVALAATISRDYANITPPDQGSNALLPDQASSGFYGQFTGVTQSHTGFNSPYQGHNSLNPSNKNATTTDLTIFAGIRAGKGEFWINPEIDQGFGLSNTVGVAGFPSGEAYKVGANTPYLRLPRVFYRQVINLGGEQQTLLSSSNQLGRDQSANNIIVTAGKFSVVDVFDTNSYAHDPRSDFLNWSIVDAGAFDYAADAWGFTKGISVEWTQSRWTLRGGFFDLSTIPNTTVLDPAFSQHEWVSELEERHQWSGHPGKVKLLGFINQGKMGSYADALQLARQTNSIPNTALVRRGNSTPGFSINIEQEIASDLGAFSRASINDGSKEAFEFTEINQSVSAGLSLKGNRWGRHDDTLALAVVANGLSSDARKYFAAGGIGILIGDGQLSHYAPEQIMETYYTYSVDAIDHLLLTLDYQYIINPAYNQDRGPVSIFGVRVHKEF